jgi:hypothetical protein
MVWGIGILFVVGASGLLINGVIRFTNWEIHPPTSGFL